MRVIATILVQLAIGLGGILLTALFTPKPRDTYGSRLSDINVTPVSPGQVIPRVWGTMKVHAQMIFSSPLIETQHTHQASSKGGGKGGLFGGGSSAKNYTFTYSIDGAWGVCGGPVYAINRIWANQKLLYVSAAAQANAQSDFDAAYQSEATRLIDEEGVQLDYAAASAFVFAFNNYDTAEVTLHSPTDAVNYIMGTGGQSPHPIVSTTLGTVTPDVDGVTAVIIQLYSGLNNADQYESQVNRFDLIEIYLGDEQQAPNGLLQGYLGMGNAPAFRGCCYFVLTNLQLMDFGNSVPSMTVEVQRTANGVTSLPEVITDVCYQAGLQTSHFDATSNVDATTFPGFCVTTNTSARQILQDLQKVFPLDAAESGYKIIFSMLNKRATQVINRQHLATHIDTEAVPPTEEITRLSDYDLPQRINFKYQEPARNFSINMLYAARYNTVSTSVEEIEVTIALDRKTAQTCVINTLGNRILARRTYKWKLPRKYITMEPTDVVQMPNKANLAFNDEYYLTQVDVGANGILDVQAIDHMFVDPSVNPSDQVGSDLIDTGNKALTTTSQTLAHLFDIPLLEDSDTDGPGFYVMLAGLFNGWQGGTLYVDAAAASTAKAYGKKIISSSAGSAWEASATSSVNVPHGHALDALKPGMNACYWDRASVLIVHVHNGIDLLSANEDDILQQSLNATFIGGEIVQYATAVSLGNQLWRISNFLRGLRGTERRMEAHVKGERFIRLTDQILRVKTTRAEVNVEDTFQAVSHGSNHQLQASFKFTDTGNSQRPLTVAVYRKFRNLVTGDLTVSWWPRVRQNGEWLSGSDVALPTLDLPEVYSVDVLSANKLHVKNTYGFSGVDVNLGATFSYTAAMQLSDFGVAQTSINMVIYQVGSVIGRGFALGVTL